jgi:phospholipase C
VLKGDLSVKLFQAVSILSMAAFFLVSGLIVTSPKPAQAAAETQALNCSKSPGTLPWPGVPAGTPDRNQPIEHIIVLMQENHSFDNYFGRLNQPQYYGSAVDGIPAGFFNLDAAGNKVYPYHTSSPCEKDPDHTWNAMHRSWNGGRNDAFVRTNGAIAMSYYDQRELPFYYELAHRFAIGDRYFSSALTQTFPNRYFLLAGTAFGHIGNVIPQNPNDWNVLTIFDVMSYYGVSWKYYTDNKQGYLALFQPMYRRNLDKMKKMADFQADLANDRLPAVVFLDASFEGVDEHPGANVQVGQAWVANQIQALMRSRAWYKSVMFLTYDESGAMFDHVSPPPACEPDGILPQLPAGSEPGRYDHYGFRVPFLAISPFVKRHYVSHVTYDHTSVLKFIETKFNLPALTRRDANANDMRDLFDYAHPNYSIPLLPTPVITRRCP